MHSQSELLGDHPNEHQFGRWLISSDLPLADGKCHRNLQNIISSNDTELIEWLARRIIYHHYDEYRLEQLKLKYTELGFPEYAKQNRKLPSVDKVKKGNATEILLIEYIESAQGKSFAKAYKFRYNPNVDQSVKGDDVLLADVSNDGTKNKVKIFMGEAKFRSTPTKNVVNEISKSLSKDKAPISYSFLVDELRRDQETKELAELLDSFMVSEIRGNGDITYTGFLFSNSSVSTVVETHLKSDNPKFVFISLGIDNPSELIDLVFNEANTLILEPHRI